MFVPLRMVSPSPGLSSPVKYVYVKDDIGRKGIKVLKLFINVVDMWVTLLICLKYICLLLNWTQKYQCR